MPVCLRQEIKSQKAFKSNKNRESRLLYQKVMIIVAVVFSERFIEITTYIKFGKKKSLYLNRAVVVVKWSACSPSTPTIRVRIPLRSTIFL